MHADTPPRPFFPPFSGRQVIDLHFAAAKSATTLLNLNTHLVARELAYILRDSEPAVIFALRSSQPLIAEAFALASASASSSSPGQDGGSDCLGPLALAVWLDDPSAGPSSSSSSSA